MERAIVDFDQDELGDWRAILACGHRQHVRHNPPLVERPWVLTEEGRQRFLGYLLDCKRCDEEGPPAERELPKRETQPMTTVTLRDVMDSDLPIFFEYQRDPAAVHMAAFTAKDPDDRAAFDAHWARILADENVLNRTIVLDDEVAGSVASYVMEGNTEITYWIDREFWDRGVATAALAAFLKIQQTRPIYARAAKDNLGSLRVLEKCGFVITGEDKGFANARGEIIEEYLLTLESA